MGTSHTITIDRVTRDTLHSEISMDVGGVGFGGLDRSDGATDALKERERAEACFALLDAIGWASEDERQAYELPVSEQAVAWLRRILGEVEQTLEADRHALAQLEAGDEGYRSVGSSVEESIKHRGEQIVHEERTHALLRSLVGRVDALDLPASCDACGAPAAFRWEYRPGCSETLCDECARYRGASDRGEASLAFDVLGFAITAARDVGVSDTHLREAFDMLLTDRSASVNSYPCGVDGILPGDRREDRPWQWRGKWERLDREAVA